MDVPAEDLRRRIEYLTTLLYDTEDQDSEDELPPRPSVMPEFRKLLDEDSARMRERR
jgi:hypothetical protein